MNTGTVSGATWTAAGKYGSALIFDGVNDRVTVPDAPSLDLTTALTLEAWVYPTAAGGWRTVLSKEMPNALAYVLYQGYGARLSGAVTIGGTQRKITTPSTLPLNTWTHLTMTYDSATIRLFVNAVEVSSLGAPGAVMSTANPLSIGGNSVWNNEWFAGRLDEIRIYNRALTPAQIQTDMKTPVGGTPNPDTTPPTVKMTAPAHGAFVGASVSVAATATDTVGVITSGVKSVQFLLDGSPLGLPDTAPPFGLTWTTAGATAGLHTLAARATDAAGNQATSTSISVTIDRTRPSVALTAPAAGATVSSIVTISANASDNGALQSVQFTLDGADLGARDTWAPYSVAWNTSTVTNGTHRLTAIARDTAGNQTTSATVTCNSLQYHHPADGTSGRAWVQ